MAPFFVAGNFKLNLGPKALDSYFDRVQGLGQKLSETEFAQFKKNAALKKSRGGVRTFIFPQAITYAYAQTLARTLFPLGIELECGIQNAAAVGGGAQTGENSVETMMEYGGKLVLLGHSERRSLFHETEESLAKKLAYATQKSLTILYCIGETLEERQSGKMNAVLRRQLDTFYAGIAKKNADCEVLIAYEPVWAIGTGQVASAAQIEEAHALIHDLNRGHGGPYPVLYGGSVTEKNVGEIYQCAGVNGVLVGGASLRPEVFFEMIKLAVLRIENPNN